MQRCLVWHGFLLRLRLPLLLHLHCQLESVLAVPVEVLLQGGGLDKPRANYDKGNASGLAEACAAQVDFPQQVQRLDCVLYVQFRVFGDCLEEVEVGEVDFAAVCDLHLLQKWV